MKLFDCLPIEIARHISTIDDVRELRIRNGGAVKLNVGGRWYYLGKDALLNTSQRALIYGEICDDIIKNACCNSVYAHEKNLAKGYFTLEDGVRIGVCGDVFGANNNVFQRYTSLCFRIPHNVNCVSEDILKRCFDSSAVIVGAPASGKTTYLRDLAVKLGQRFNVLVVDERGEIFYDEYLAASSGCDVLKWADKPYAFEVGVRALSPQYIVCDELTEGDIPFVKSCLSCGVKLICSAHGANEADFDKRFGLLDRFGVVVNLNNLKHKTAT